MIRHFSKIIFVCLLTVFAADAGAAESVCLSCHANIANDWRQSIHAQNGISCHNCHGGNPKDAATAMDPKFGFVGKPQEAQIPSFCGKCHVGVKENYSKSAHSAALTTGGPSCVTCHTAHKQKRARIELISPGLCDRCHSFDRAEKIRNAMFVSEAEITNLEERIEALRVQGYNVDVEKKELFATRNQFHKLTHVVNVGLITRETGDIQSKIQTIKNDISFNERNEVKRKIYGSLVILFLFVGVIVFWWYSNTILSDKSER